MVLRLDIGHHSWREFAITGEVKGSTGNRPNKDEGEDCNAKQDRDE